MQLKVTRTIIALTRYFLIFNMDEVNVFEIILFLSTLITVSKVKLSYPIFFYLVNQLAVHFHQNANSLGITISGSNVQRGLPAGISMDNSSPK